MPSEQPAPPLSDSSHFNTSNTSATHRPLPRRSSTKSPTPASANRIIFTPSSLSSDKGFRDITRDVIDSLEGMGYIESEDRNGHVEVDDHEELAEVEKDLRQQDDASQVDSHTIQEALINSSALPAKAAQKVKIDWEIPRKVFHSSIGFVTVYLYVSNGSPRNVILVLWSALAVIVPTDYVRLHNPRFERIYEKCLGFLMRESERHQTNGVIWYILGVNFALTFYPLDVATVSILILSWADTAASTIGRLWGSKTPPLPSHLPILRLPFAARKSSAGFLAATVTGACISAGFWGLLAPIRTNPADVSWIWDTGVSNSTQAGLTSLSGWVGLGIIAVFAGLVGGIAEALDLKLDDNLTLPIISGGCILGFLKLFGLFSGA